MSAYNTTSHSTIGPACTISITPTEHGITVHTSIDADKIAQNGGMKATEALAQIGMRAIQQVLNEYEQQVKRASPLH